MSPRNPLLIGVIGLTFSVGCSFDRSERVSDASGMEDRKVDHAQKARPAPPPRITADTHLAAGRMLEKQGDLLAAVAQYERAIVSEPRLVQAYNRLGIVYQKLGRFTDADHAFESGLRADPGSVTLNNNMGYSLLLQQRFEDAEHYFRDALTIDPEFERARMNLAITLGYLGRTEESRSEFTRVVSADIAHYNVAMLELHRGNYVAARKLLNDALALNPSCPGAVEQLRRVEALAAGDPSAAPAPSLQLQGPLAGTPTPESEVVP